MPSSCYSPESFAIEGEPTRPYARIRFRKWVAGVALAPAITSRVAVVEVVLTTITLVAAMAFRWRLCEKNREAKWSHITNVVLSSLLRTSQCYE